MNMNVMMDGWMDGWKRTPFGNMKAVNQTEHFYIHSLYTQHLRLFFNHAVIPSSLSSFSVAEDVGLADMPSTVYRRHWSFNPSVSPRCMGCSHV